MRNWKEKGLNQKPINLTMKELRDTNIRQSYIDRLESKRNYEQAQAELEDAKIDYYTAEPPVAPKPKTKAPTPFDLPKPQPGPSKTKNEKEIITEWRPKTTTQPQADNLPPSPPIAPPLASFANVALPKFGRFMDQATQQPTPEQLAKLKQLKRPTAPGDSAIYVVNRTTREREKIELNSKDIINRLSELDKSDPNALLIIQTPNENVVKRIEKEIAKSGRDDRYIVIFGDENVNAKQAQQDSIKRINAIKNVLNSDSSPVSTSDNDPAPAEKPATTRRYRP